MEYRDCEYGDYKDMNNECGWWDDFAPPRSARRDARDKYDEVMDDLMREIASENGFPHEQTAEWDSDDWEIFRNIMDL